MKRILPLLVSILSLTLLSACTEDKVHPTPEGIRIENTSITLSAAGTATISFKYTDMEFNYSINSPSCQISLEVVGSDTEDNIGKEPYYYKLSNVELTDKAKGLYKATIKDRAKRTGYNESVVLKIKSSDSEVVRSEKFDVCFVSSSIESMSFLKSNNETAIYKDIKLDHKGKNINISSPYISNPNLVLSFEVYGGKVTVNGVEQQSGVTANDFSSPVKYKVAYASGKVEEYTVSVTYSGLPVLFINTPNNKTIPDKHSDWLAGTEITLYNSDWTINHSGTTGIRGRGNSTWSYPKKPYALKLDSKVSILGMPKHKRWVLLANWMDRTIMRNRVAFEIASRSSLAWTPRGEFVELILNGEHKGNYYLCEHIKVDENRVNIDELEDNQTDGGYIMELDTYYDETHKFKSAYYRIPYMFKDPDEVSTAQFSFMQNYINTLEASLNSSSRFAAREYTDYIDVDSFIDWWIVHELTGNEEPKHPKSSYMHKNTGGKLTMGPVWDFDWGTFMPHTKFVILNRTDGLKPIYYDRLFQDAQFKSRVKERWNALKADLETIPDFIDSEADRIKGSESMNHKMWPCNTQEVIGSIVNKDENITFEQAISRMKSAYTGKFTWMDSQINKW